MPFRNVLLLSVALAACTSSSPAIPTTAPPGVPTTTTTIVNDTCGRLIEDTALFLETVIEVLDQSTLDEVRDREHWPEGLVALERQGKDLDARAAAMRCDAAEVQTAALQRANLDPDSDLARYLVELFE